MCPKAVRQMNDGGRHPLHEACRRKLSDSVILMLFHSFPDAARHKDDRGMTPSHHIAQIRYKMFAWLVQNGDH
jgi:hypothetical protein